MPILVTPDLAEPFFFFFFFPLHSVPNGGGVPGPISPTSLMMWTDGGELHPFLGFFK